MKKFRLIWGNVLIESISFHTFFSHFKTRLLQVRNTMKVYNCCSYYKNMEDLMTLKLKKNFNYLDVGNIDVINHFKVSKSFKLEKRKLKLVRNKFAKHQKIKKKFQRKSTNPQITFSWIPSFWNTFSVKKSS